MFLVFLAAFVLALIRFNHERNVCIEILGFLAHHETNLLEEKQILVDWLNHGNEINDRVIKDIVIGDNGSGSVAQWIADLDKRITEIREERRVIESKLSSPWRLILGEGQSGGGAKGTSGGAKGTSLNLDAD